VGFPVEPLMQKTAVRPFSTGAEKGVGCLLVGGFQRERNELIKGLLAGCRAGTRADAEKAQRNPQPPPTFAIAHLNAGKIPITHRNREVPLGGMAVDRHLLQGVVWGGGRRKGRWDGRRPRRTRAAGFLRTAPGDRITVRDLPDT